MNPRRESRAQRTPAQEQTEDTIAKLKFDKKAAREIDEAIQN